VVREDGRHPSSRGRARAWRGATVTGCRGDLRGVRPTPAGRAGALDGSTLHREALTPTPPQCINLPGQNS